MNQALEEELRLDLCLHNLRFCKTRALAQELIAKGRVRVNGQACKKSSRKIRSGDILVFPAHQKIYAIEIIALPTKRQGASIAEQLYKILENSAPNS